MDLPIGYRKFHKDKFINYQMNRLYSLGFGRAEDIEEASAVIKKHADVCPTFEQQANKARAEARLKNAAAYLRTAEFFVDHSSPKRIEAYKEFRKTWDEAFLDECITRHKVPYSDSYLPALEVQPSTTSSKGTILMFGGFDSVIEEFYVMWMHFASAGYRVIAFEGPGQGGARRLYGHLFDHDGEKPTSTMLDYFRIDEAVAIGISMGGYWVVRAAAYEPRIKQIVSWSLVFDWLAQLPPLVEPLLHRLLRYEGFMNWSIRLRMRAFPILDFAMKQAMYLVDGKVPMDGVRWILNMNKNHVSSERVTQNALLITGEKDAFQPVKLLRKQEAALTNAKSITTRVFTKAEKAHMHCQMGNLNLALNYVEQWINEKVE